MGASPGHHVLSLYTSILVFGNIPNILAAFFKELALITIREMWGLGLGFHGKVSVSKFEPGLDLGDYGLDCITGLY